MPCYQVSRSILLTCKKLCDLQSRMAVNTHVRQLPMYTIKIKVQVRQLPTCTVVDSRIYRVRHHTLRFICSLNCLLAQGFSTFQIVGPVVILFKNLVPPIFFPSNSKYARIYVVYLHPKAGQNTFFCVFSTFFLFVKVFSGVGGGGGVN